MFKLTTFMGGEIIRQVRIDDWEIVDDKILNMEVLYIKEKGSDKFEDYFYMIEGCGFIIEDENDYVVAERWKKHGYTNVIV